MQQSWKLTIRTVCISILLGFGAGVLGTALTSNYLSDYALTLGELSAPTRLSEELPRSSPQTYGDAVREVTESVLPGVVRFYSVGSYAEPFASGAVLTSDGWILTSWEYPVSGAFVTAVIGGRSYPVVREVKDSFATGASFVKVDASNLPVFAFGSGFDLAPGDQLFAAPSPTALFAETVVEARWLTGSLSSDAPQRLVAIEDPLLGAYQGSPVVNVRGELVGLVTHGSAGFTFVLPIDGVLPAFNAV